MVWGKGGSLLEEEGRYGRFWNVSAAAFIREFSFGMNNEKP